MRATDRAGRGGSVAPVAPPDAMPEGYPVVGEFVDDGISGVVPVVFTSPATPEDDADAWRRWVDALDWLATIGALDA